METTKLDGQLLKAMLVNGYLNCRINSEALNRLNVFPVPDGDTGTNMLLTMEGGVKSPSAGVAHTGELLTLFTHGMLFGARGNSGIILSQFFQGISDYCAELPELSADDFSKALQSGVRKAYESVINPVEGTMLTVMRESVKQVADNRHENFEGLFSQLLEAMRLSLEHTPELLPVLKNAGVVDSGGAGIVCITEGMLMALNGCILPDDGVPAPEKATADFDAADDEYGYCTEFLLSLNERCAILLNLNDVTEFLCSVGDSVVALRNKNVVKAHVHTHTPGRVIEYAQQYGSFISVKIENMSLQHNETMMGEKKRYAVVAVCSGDGITSYFREIGADVVIDGGQTDNPSVEDFLTAYRSANAESIIVLPNNGNTIMAAQRSKELYDGEVVIVETKTPAEGYSALSMMDLSCESAEEVANGMREAISNVTTGLVTYAVRDATINGLTFSKGDYLGLDSETILTANSDKTVAASELIIKIVEATGKMVVTAFSGESVTDDENQKLQSVLRKKYPLMEFSVIKGLQKIYDFIFAVE